METETVKRTCARCGEDFLVKTKGPGKQKRFCSDECRKLCWNKASRVPCDQCGTLRRGHSPGLCVDCYKAQRTLERDAVIKKVADLYNAGVSIDEISVYLGWSDKSKPSVYITEARRRRLVGYRYKGCEKRNDA